MATSDPITVSGLTATPGIGLILLQWSYSDPHLKSLPDLQLDAVEVHASQTNDRTTATKVCEGQTNALHVALTEGATWYYWIRARNHAGGFGDWHPSSSTAGVQASVSYAAASISAVSVYALINGYIAATVAGNSLTISIKTLAGTDPSASNPVACAFLGASLSSGAPVVRQITAATSLTITNGSYLGVIPDNTPFRIWVVLLDDSGTVRIGAKVCSISATIIHPINEAGLASAVAEGGAGGADTLGQLYAAVTVTNKPLRIVAQLDWSAGLPTNGAWSAGPTAIRLVASGTQRPSSVLQERAGSDAGSYTTTAVIPWDDTLPQIGEGFQIDAWSMTPAAACNIFDIEVVANVAHSVASEIVGALFVDGAANAVAADFDYVSAANALTQLKFRFRVRANSVSEKALTLRIGPSQAGTMTFNGSGGSRKLGGAAVAYYRTVELAG